MASRFIAEALQRGGKVVVACPNGLDCSAVVLLTYLMKQGVPLLGGYKLLKCFEPLIQLSRSNTLFVTLFEIDEMHATSVKSHKTLASPVFLLMARYCNLVPPMTIGMPSQANLYACVPIITKHDK